MIREYVQMLIRSPLFWLALAAGLVGWIANWQ